MLRRQQIIIAAALIVAGLGVTAFYIYQRPRAVVEQAVRNLATRPAQNFTADLRVENTMATQAALKEKGTVEVHLQGNYDRSPKRPSLASNIDLTIRTESVSLQLSGEARLIEDKFFIHINKTPPIWPALQAMKGKWVELSRGGQQKDLATSPADILFAEVRRTGKNHYQAQATQAAVVRFMNTLAEIMGTELSEQQLIELRNGIGRIERLPVALTITSFTHRLQRLETTIAVPNGNAVHFVLQLEPLNKPASITAPDGAVTLEAALKKE